MLLRAFEFIALVVISGFFLFQFLYPLIDGRKTFPMFRKNVKTLDKVELELNEAEYEAQRANNLKQKAESIDNE